MSVASRARQRQLYLRRGHPTFAAFRAWQRDQLENWCEAAYLPDPWRGDFAGVEPIIYPEPPQDSPPFPLVIAPISLQPAAA